MPHRVICGKCEAVLYEGKDVKPPYEIVTSYNGKCPNCAKKLLHSPLKIQINSFPSREAQRDWPMKRAWWN